MLSGSNFCATQFYMVHFQKPRVLTIFRHFVPSCWVLGSFLRDTLGPRVDKKCSFLSEYGGYDRHLGVVFWDLMHFVEFSGSHVKCLSFRRHLGRRGGGPATDDETPICACLSGCDHHPSLRTLPSSRPALLVCPLVDLVTTRGACKNWVAQKLEPLSILHHQIPKIDP